MRKSNNLDILGQTQQKRNFYTFALLLNAKKEEKINFQNYLQWKFSSIVLVKMSCLYINPIHSQRFPNSFTPRGVGDQHPLKPFLIIYTSHFINLASIAQWQSISHSFCRLQLQILIYSRHRRFESNSRQIFFIYL